jgi:hypothetical protein
MLFFQSGIVVLNRSSPSSNTIIMFSAAFANAVHPVAAAFHPDACFTFIVIKFLITSILFFNCFRFLFRDTPFTLVSAYFFLYFQ